MKCTILKTHTTQYSDIFLHTTSVTEKTLATVHKLNLSSEHYN